MRVTLSMPSPPAGPVPARIILRTSRGSSCAITWAIMPPILRIDGRHASARQDADGPRPLRPGSRPRRGDGREAARRPGITASQHTPRRATTTTTSGLARRRLAPPARERSVGEAAHAHRVLAAIWVPDPLTAHCSGRQLGVCPRSDPDERNNEPPDRPRNSVTRGAQRSTRVAAGDPRNAA
jgi:hypothetical protein